MLSHIFSDIEAETDAKPTTDMNKKRRRNKPIIEKKRRARINKCLSQLKEILIKDEHKAASMHTKWEKADVLEMTVEYLQDLRQRCEVIKPKPSHQQQQQQQQPTLLPQSPPAQMFPIFHNYLAFQQLMQLQMRNNLQPRFDFRQVATISNDSGK